MRLRLLRPSTVVLAALTLIGAACSSDTAEELVDGPPVTVASFNFPESEILAEIYAQTLEDAGIAVERQLNLGARELIYPQVSSGDIDLLPEYLGSALVVGFGAEPPSTVSEGLEQLRAAFADEGVMVFEPAPAENNQAFVVTSDFAAEHALSTVSDLSSIDAVSFAGPPECEDRDTCFAGLQSAYGLENVSFSSIQEAAARLAALDAGDVSMILLFSTDAPLALDTYVVLEEDAGMLPPENITPIVRSEIIDAYGDSLADLIASVTALITTESLQQMNALASEGLASDQIAAQWIDANL